MGDEAYPRCAQHYVAQIHSGVFPPASFAFVSAYHFSPLITKLSMQEKKAQMISELEWQVWFH